MWPLINHVVNTVLYSWVDLLTRFKEHPPFRGFFSFFLRSKALFVPLNKVIFQAFSSITDEDGVALWLGINAPTLSCIIYVYI